MADFIVVQLVLFFLLSGSAFGKVDRLHSEVYLGEKELDSYAGRYQPLIFQDIYLGKMTFEDEIFFQHYFSPLSFASEKELSFFLKSELSGGLFCPNEMFSEHFDDMRYSYRLISLSYLIEGQWHLKLLTDHFKLKDGCHFDLQKWVDTCKPVSESMKKFISRLKKYGPKYIDTFPPTYKKEDWYKEYVNGKPQFYSQYRFQNSCPSKCPEADVPEKFASICLENQKLMDLICSEKDELYGLSSQRDAYYLIGQSNIINTFNKKGEAMGCLRRFSEVMSHKEVKYQALDHLFPALQTYLRQKFEERFLQGRVFFFGSGKEFEDKGLKELYVKEQKLKIATIKQDAPVKVAVQKKPVPEAPKGEVVMAAPVPVQKKELVEIRGPLKSAFLQAAEVRAAQNLPRVEVDMLKLKYDYVFTLNMMNTLSDRLKTFMTREALIEMVTYDKLGSVEGPVPLLFIKFMIDMQEHQGLWNIITTVGDKFYVTNEIDGKFNPGLELVHLVNNESTGRQWQLFILRP